MKRAVAMAVLLAAALAAQAQFRGMRAPVARPMPSGIRPGVMPIAPRVAPAPQVRVMPAPGHRGFGPRFAGPVFNNGFGIPNGFQFFSINSCDPFVFPCGALFSSPNAAGIFRFRHGHFFSPFFGNAGFGFGGFGLPIFADYPETTVAPQPAVQPQPIIIYAQPPPGEQPEETSAEPPIPAEQAKATPPPQPERPLPPAVLIFRDGTRKEIENFAIVGDTLYEFLPNSRKKIPLSDLDLPATIKANDERGVDFSVPSHKGS